jgi:hypothetical protein
VWRPFVAVFVVTGCWLRQQLLLEWDIDPVRLLLILCCVLLLLSLLFLALLSASPVVAVLSVTAIIVAVQVLHLVPAAFASPCPVRTGGGCWFHVGDTDGLAEDMECPASRARGWRIGLCTMLKQKTSATVAAQ